MAGIAQQHDEHDGRRQLEQELLGGGEPLILMELHLAKVIDKADDAEYQRKREHDEGAEIPGLEILPARGQNGNENAHNEHDAAHSRGALLVHVPLGADLLDGLSRLQGVEPRNQEASDQRRHGEGHNKTDDRSNHICCILSFCSWRNQPSP